MKKTSFFYGPILLTSLLFSSCGNNSVPTPSVNIPVTGVYLNYQSIELEVGKSYLLKTSISPTDATNQNVTWSSLDEGVASVNSGLVTAVSAGETTVNVTTVDGNYTASCVVNVIEDSDDDYNPPEVDSDIFYITEDTLSSGTYDIEKDEYTFAVSGNYKQIFVNAPEKTIVVELSDANITNSENSPIYVLDCDTIEISAKKNKTSNIIDSRPMFTEEDTSQGKGAIYVSNGDLKLKGAGTLNVSSSYYNGIHCKDDVKIQKLTLNVNAVNHGIRGNDSITISSGDITISCGGDGLHSDNSDLSSSLKQRGNITINGGTINIDSWKDALAASYDAIFEELDGVSISFTANTNTYSSYEGETVPASTTSLYLKMNSQTYASGAYTYAAYINNTWYKANFKEQVTEEGGPGGRGPGGGGGWSSTYYVYEIERPTSATSFTLYRFSGSNVTEFSTTSYNAVSSAKTFSSAYDMIQLSVSGSTISLSNWSTYNSKGESTKGIKANNEVKIISGTIVIKSVDDAIHANNDNYIESGVTPLGNVNISGGSITVTSKDDGIHADGTLTISGGEINVLTSYEGIEGNIINITGGTSYVYSTNDGMNASKGNSTPAINISGGYLDVEVPTNGDTDGIDSNGTYTQTGGVVITKGPGSASSYTMGSAALDSDGAVTLSGGTIIVYGGIEKTPTTTLTKTLCSSSTVSTGSHTVSFGSGEAYSTTLKTSSRGCVVYSELGSATLS